MCDEIIRRNIESNLLSERALEGRGIIVKVENGVATLAGEVPYLADRLAAVRVTMSVPGVRAVADDIRTEWPLTAVRSDADIATAAADALRDHPDLHGCRLKPLVYGGKVALSGEVDHLTQRELAEDLVQHLAGVKQVLNDIKLVSKAAFRATEAPTTNVRAFMGRPTS